MQRWLAMTCTTSPILLMLIAMEVQVLAGLCQRQTERERRVAWRSLTLQQLIKFAEGERRETGETHHQTLMTWLCRKIRVPPSSTGWETDDRPPTHSNRGAPAGETSIITCCHVEAARPDAQLALLK
ncbi:hypothetical protein P7K49_022982 [Saguinus oedipus]|uniref:Secreted protein n=1 Tax=Saguinus oedipus TaxID=9490 RepID=A0ABQ9UKC7_SAGOE|nr:hypothetical protein P7K49_022982 [Saguinus oedipus]